MDSEEQLNIPETLPVLVLRDIVVFPYMIVPLYVGRTKSKRAVDKALNSDRMILLLTQKDPNVEDPTEQQLYMSGTVGLIVRMLKLPDGRMRVLVQGISRVKVNMLNDDGRMINADVRVVEDKEPKRLTMKDNALIKNVREKFEQTARMGKQIPNEMFVIVENIDEPGKLADIIAANLDLKIPDSEKILAEERSMKRLAKVYDFLTYELEMLNIQNQINMKAQGEMDKNQREYFLRQQLKAIQKELGEDAESSEEISNYLKKIKEVKLSEEARKEVEKNIERLKKMHPESAESTVVRNYLDWMLELPWSVFSKDNLNIRRARTILNQDHYGLEKVKERILEYLSVRKLTSKAHGPILCFVGPPGVGKTSLGRSIARALNKKFVRISLGGVRDEAEIRGHRRTYVGALPGKIIMEVKKVGSANPVFMMDEVDKIGTDFRGDPSSALLEVLDPEQNNSFVDHYLGVAFDLSKVLFITTANMLEPIQPAFKDRMEVIHIHGYTEEEKIEIAKRHLIPRQYEANGLNKKLVDFTTGAIKNLIALNTREAGVRNLEREIGSICRKVAHKVAVGEKRLHRITIRNLEKYTGPPKIFKDQLLDEDTVGVATGMAWTPFGGDILFIEVKLMPGKGKLILTGSLGDVMKESATAALTFLKSKSDTLSIKTDTFEKKDIHIHIPEGGTPKDGPSAGVSLTTALCSAFTDIPVKRQIAMTGEITLRGKVIPVGGIKEKVLAAKRAGITKIILPEKNKKDLADIKENYLTGIDFIFAKNITDVVDTALAKRVFNG
ncbi:MAG: endopeptidase La [Candidatus Aminicenantes bacterium]|nr:endopeptidase La [Candidatus Aminicenantes bacterium]NIM79061.1 endopeptidase La [Candidatus Aminicenantes bacterium]NIN18340.1 endopeptidase La [Candidatus Aminicenantes bacterium]NIN42227.1 endopeptidase La [Candidatus Aminicenantes bacterium]NIN84993.1 endopeptidase La [Candidatus Aminicenantes bacterium]